MARDASGNMSLIYDWTDDSANGIPITDTRFNAQEQDIADEITKSISTEGVSTINQNIPFNSKRITGFPFL